MAILTRSYRIRAYPNGAQRRLLDRWFGATRWLWNTPKLGSLKLAEGLPEVERPDLVTLSRDAAGRYHVSFCAQVQTSLLPITHRVVGVDVGQRNRACLEQARFG